MTGRINTHVFVDGKCIHCGETEAHKETSCLWRDAAPRPTPESIFAKPWEIGEIAKKIRAEEDAALAGVEPHPEADS